MRKALIISSLLILGLFLFTSCGEKYDVDKVSDISIIKKGEDPYELTCLEVADMLDKYIYLKKANCKRGTQKYRDFLHKEALKDKELRALVEWPAIKYYIHYYDNPTGTIEDMDNNGMLDEDKLPEDMTNQTIREFVFSMQGDEI